MRTVSICLAVAMVSACVQQQPLTDYRPVVDPKAKASRHYEANLRDCRQIALKVEADYKKRASDEMAANLFAGLLVGAVAGAVVGNNTGMQGDYIAAGAASGAAAGAVGGDYTHDLVTYGPRRVVDRCMMERGHAVLNDIGKG
jgi:uncharacterized protein YcfJ